MRKELVSLLDLYPTFCEIAKTKAPLNLPGRALKPILFGEVPNWRKYLFTEFHLHSNHNPWPQRTVRDQRYKLIYNPLAGSVNPGYKFTMSKKFFTASEDQLLAYGSDKVRKAYKLMKEPPIYELYDLKEDPHEFNNIFENAELETTRTRLISELKSWQLETGDVLTNPENARRLFDLVISLGTDKREVLDYSFMNRSLR